MRHTTTSVLICLVVVLELVHGKHYQSIEEVNVDHGLQMSKEKRSFTIDWDKNTFLKNGRPFRFIAGSFHYFRSHPGSWQRKLRTMRAAGLNAVTTYVEWSLHNPKDGVYVWDGIADLEKFIKYAVVEDLYVILRPGPYICAERDMGGFPYWLLTKYPNIQLRTVDMDYLFEVRIWYSKLMTKMEPFLYGNGGPIIMVQVENEYGSYYACDQKYREWLRNETFSYVKNNAVLFTNDGPSVLKCGHIDGVLATLDFGATKDPNTYWKQLRKIQPSGPLVNAEYYPGWLTHWQEPFERVTSKSINKTFIDMLNQGANVNFYMFYGGTNFGFTAGANTGGPGEYNADITSYDYDAPMDESGAPTQKYHDIREVIGKYLPLPDIPVPISEPKKHYGTVWLSACCSILSPEARNIIATEVISSYKPLSFEALNQYSGLVLYETDLPKLARDPSELRVNIVHDRAYVYVDNMFIGVLSRENQIHTLSINAGAGRKLKILVENQGRINYGIANDFKGILSDVMIDKTVLRNWNMTKYQLESYEDILILIEKKGLPATRGYTYSSIRELLYTGPYIFYGELEIKDVDELHDTYLDPSGWGKGIAFVNGENLGRYWPVVGPQITLYVPKDILKIGTNHIVLIEYQRAPENLQITFTNIPNLDGP